MFLSLVLPCSCDDSGVALMWRFAGEGLMERRRGRRHPAVVALAVLAMAVATTAGGRAQEAQAPKKPLPPPKTIDLKTKDGLDLKATFYGSNLGKEAAVIILLHGHKGRRSDFDALAAALQKLGHAVLVPDLR